MVAEALTRCLGWVYIIGHGGQLVCGVTIYT